MMTNGRLRKVLAVTAATLMCAAVASAQTTKRPIQDWITPNLSACGVYWYDSGNPVSPYITFDYFGSANAAYSLNLGTTIKGTVTETALKDGTAKVHVVMQSTNVLAWAYSIGFGPLIFGHTPGQVQGGADAALGSTLLTVDFNNSAPGAPLPSLCALSFTPSASYQLNRVGLTANAQGTLRAAVGVPDGTPGVAHTTQRGLYQVPGMYINGHDVFPAEKVDIHPLGH